MDIASLVRSITSSFEDATVLVKRIRDQKQHQSSNNATSELIESLELGPVVVKGYFNADAKRFGDAYTTGDSIAREQLKDVLIHLQMTVLTTLRLVMVDDQDLDCGAIQAAADDCRVNTGVSLGQLSQRLADPSRAHQYANHVASFPFRLNDSTPDCSSVSSQSSEGPRTPTTPELEAMMEEVDYPGRLPGFNPYASNLRGKSLAVLQGAPSRASPRAYTKSPSRSSAVRSPDSLDSWTGAGGRRQGSAMDNVSDMDVKSAVEEPLVFSPVSPASASTSNWNRESTGTASSVRSGIGGQSNNIGRAITDNTPRERYGPDDYSDIYAPYYNTHADPRPVSRHRQRRSASPPLASQQLHFPHRPSHPTHVSRPSQSSLTTMSHYPLANRSNVSVNAPIPVIVDEAGPPVPLKAVARKPSNESQTRHQHQPQQQQPALSHGARKILGDVDPYLDSFVGEPNFPTEKNLMGYCKGAQRLQNGSDKKAFIPAQRPVGYSGFVQFWKCDKCHFEGPMKGRSRSFGSKTKSEKIFDPAVREYNGIRFRWAFLAKCHVPLKNQTNRADGMSGSFGCIFCTAEAKNRNWVIGSEKPGPDGRIDPDLAFLPSESTPIFGNSSSFMDHLQMHRQHNYWPNKEMQRRMKCVVGRVAAAEEDFEINFMPLEATRSELESPAV